MFKTRFIAVLCAFLLLLTGCARKDDFADCSITEYPPIENVSAKTEFAEYDGNVEKILVDLTNDRDEYFSYDFLWWLDKEADGEWRRIHIIKERYNDLADHCFSRGTISIVCELKGNVKQPLLPGHYRIWVGGEGERVPAEFIIKE